MNKIESFKVDHRTIKVGVYISRVDNDITTYDMRTRKPNTDDVMDNLTMHTIEHMFATLIRNSQIADDIIYFGPMGCQTGFYLLVRNADNLAVIDTIKSVLLTILDYNGDVFGASEVECGNYRTLDLASAKTECLNYYNAIKEISVENIKY